MGNECPFPALTEGSLEGKGGIMTVHLKLTVSRYFDFPKKHQSSAV